MEQPPMSARSAPAGSVLGGTGHSLLANAAGAGRDAAHHPVTARAASSSGARSQLVQEDPELRSLKARFFDSKAEQLQIRKERYHYPRKKEEGGAAIDDEASQRRIMGFGLGFEKIFATTSIKLPIVAYTVFAELHLNHKQEIYSRVFNGLNTVFDMKKWVHEKLWVPLNAYDLSYAEPGKAVLTDSLRIITTEESVDTRTLATTRAVHRTYTGVPGVHSMGDIGVTRLYVRLKCRKCGDLLNTLQTCRKAKTFGKEDPVADPHLVSGALTGRDIGDTLTSRYRQPSEQEALEDSNLSQFALTDCQKPSRHGVPGVEPTIEEVWYRPDEKKHCLFHSRGYEMFESGRAHDRHGELARIYVSCDKEPSKKLRLAEHVLSKHGAHSKIQY
eukprot:TRINITY_DN63100_c0_g1_i1.p1 TRINITY_DN63100_c0_g1~~TRINITY_DN63100_c0_g1_i1.p1  ORF type:complete len:417 (-),score=56.71 TRINITY_DN63100_c0_g1_i1:122-1285(-)